MCVCRTSQRYAISYYNLNLALTSSALTLMSTSQKWHAKMNGGLVPPSGPHGEDLRGEQVKPQLNCMLWIVLVGWKLKTHTQAHRVPEASEWGLYVTAARPWPSLHHHYNCWFWILPLVVQTTVQKRGLPQKNDKGASVCQGLHTTLKAKQL